MRNIKSKPFFLFEKVLAILLAVTVAFSAGTTLVAAAETDVVDEEAVTSNTLTEQQKKAAIEAYNNNDPEFFEHYTIDENGNIKSISEESSYGKTASDATTSVITSRVNSATLPAGYRSSDGYTSAKCIDISSWNGNIDWAKVKKAGISCVILRAGFRGWGDEGNMLADTKFSTNIQEAYAAGLKIGVYFFSQATTTTEAKAEATKTISIINSYRGKISLPVAFDFEYTEGRLSRNTFSDSTRISKQTAICEAYCDAIKAGGYTPMVYASKTVFLNDLNVATLEKKYKIWMAHYTGGSATTYTRPMYMWQYSSTGKVDGISSTNVDMNYLFTIGYKLVSDSKGYKCQNIASKAYAKSKWVYIGGKYYYAGSDGYCYKGLKTIGGKKYYFNSNCSAKTYSWLTIGGKKYYCGAKGLICTGYNKAGSYYYYFNSSGVMQSGGTKTFGGKTYRLLSNGKSTIYKVKATSSQKLRSSASTKAKAKGTLKKGKSAYIIRTKSGWGQTQKGYWIILSATKVTVGYPYEKANYYVKTTANLNIRKGPSTSVFGIVGKYAKGKTVKIIQKKGNWGKVADGKWICLTYTKKI